MSEYHLAMTPDLNWGSRRAGDHLATLANANFVKFPKSFSESFTKCSLLSQNVLRVLQKFGNIETIALKTITFSPNLSPNWCDYKMQTVDH